MMIQGMTDYHVLCEDSIPNLQAKVRQYLLSGWHCVGGVHTQDYATGYPNGATKTWYLQAMGWVP